MQCRLLYVVGQLGPGGLERQLYYLLKTIDRDRYRPEVVVWSFREDDIYVSHIRKLGVPLHSFPSAFSRTRKLLELRRLVKRIKPQVIHSYSFHTNFVAWWAARGVSSVAVGAQRSDFTYDQRSCGFLLWRLSSTLPGNQIYNSAAAAERVRGATRVFLPRQISVIRNGIDLELFQSVPLSKNGDVQILGVGSLLQIKRWDRLLDAASKLKTRGLQFRVKICGSGPLRPWLEGRARELRVTDRVEILGHSDQIPDMLASATLLAHTSDVEGCPNVVMEAMACGRAVVATDVGDVSSLVEDGKTGFVVGCGDNEALLDRLAKLINDRDLCRTMGEAARAKAVREFGAERLVAETFTAYKMAGWGDS